MPTSRLLPVAAPFDVAVRGAGTVARCLALALARRGLRVALPAGLAAPGVPDLRAYALNAASVALLDELKVWGSLPADAVTPVYDMQVEGDRGGAVLAFSAYTQRVRQLAFIVDAGALDAQLDAAVRFSPQITLLAAGQAAESPPLAPLVAITQPGAGGAAVDAGWQRHDYGQRAIAARLVADRPHAGVARQWFRSPDVLALLPFGRPAPDRSYGLVWSLPRERAEALQQLDAAGFEAALADATGGAVGPLQLASERPTWPLALASADHWCGPGWVLLGEAAHQVHPLAGQGLNLGLADVAALADVLATREPWRALGDSRLLGRYVRRRALATQLMSQVTDGLWHLFANSSPAVRELRNRGLGLLDSVAPLKRWLAGHALES